LHHNAVGKWNKIRGCLGVYIIVQDFFEPPYPTKKITIDQAIKPTFHCFPENSTKAVDVRGIGEWLAKEYLWCHPVEDEP